jgi:type IV pilus assembly protein PilV
MKLPAHRPIPPPGAQTGVGLLEILIAVVILSIGLLGIAALQAKSLSTNNSAMARAMATVASYSILDGLRADRPHALHGDYNKTVTASDCPDAGGTLASHQLHSWCEQLASNLGPADTTTGQVKCGDTGDCTITITFDDSRAGMEENSQHQDSSQLKITTRAAI